VVELIGRHQEARPQEGYNLHLDFRNFVYQARVESGSHGFALQEIENGRRKVQRPVLYHLDEGTAIGSLCKQFAKSFAKDIGKRLVPTTCICRKRWAFTPFRLLTVKVELSYILCSILRCVTQPRSIYPVGKPDAAYFREEGASELETTEWDCSEARHKACSETQPNLTKLNLT